MRALLITKEGVQEVQIGPEVEKLHALLSDRVYENPDLATLQSMYRLLDCTAVCGAGYPNPTHACWADDEALFTVGEGTQVTLCSWYPQELVGKLLVTGMSSHGDTIPATLSVAELQSMVKIGELRAKR